MSFRWTPEAVAAFEQRAKKWKAEGRIITHTLGVGREAQPGNKRGGRPASKYGNIKAEADGLTFHSKAERGRWMDLRLEETSGAIKNLKRQVSYPLEVNGMKVCAYIADFVYDRDDELVVEDTKGYRTEIYRLKAKLMLACHGITVLET